jgi:ketosteroid isomerase-like protein
MNKFLKLTMFASAVLALGSCGGGATDNKPGNTTSTNAAKPAAAAPTLDALVALDKQANEAYFKSDAKFFEGFLNDKFVMLEGGQRMNKAAIVKMIAGGKCEVKDWKLEDPQMAIIDADTAVLSYKNSADGTCNGPDGKPMKVPSPMRAATVWVRNGDKWQPVFHGENAILDPKATPAAKSSPAAPAKTDAKTDEARKDTADTPAPPPPGANTEALVKIELSGWEAWKAKDAKKLEEFTAKNVSILGGDGSWMNNKADIVKFWAEMPCENVKNVSVTEGFSTALSPTVEMLTFKGTSDGTCFGQKNGVQPSMSIYVKEGDAWKLAFGFSAATM